MSPTTPRFFADDSSVPRALLATLVLVSVLGCGDEQEEATPRQVAVGEDWSERLAAPSVEGVLEALAQSHKSVRSSLGPHRLHYETSFTLGANPQASATEDSLTQPEQTSEDQQERAPSSHQQVKDKVTLLWAAERDQLPRFTLQQENDHERGREIVVADERIYTKLRYRPWSVGPLESELHEVWLDDAQRGVLDVLALAAPRLRIEPIDSADIGERSTMAVRLALDSTTWPDRVPSRAAAWRHEARISAIDGSLVLDRASGAWLRADIVVSYDLPTPRGPVPGTVELHGAVDPQAADAVHMELPVDARERYERPRLEPTRQRLLDGVAAP